MVKFMGEVEADLDYGICDDKPREECGVAAVLLKDETINSKLVPYTLDLILSKIQRRGQSGTGIGIHRMSEGKYFKPFVHRKKPVDVDTFFGGVDMQKRSWVLSSYRGIAGIGHVRYTTSGEEEEGGLQPFYRRHGKRSKRFVFAFNGNEANYSELEADLLSHDYELETGTDTEIIMHLVSIALKQQQIQQGGGNFDPNFFDLSRNLMNQLDGSYSLVMLLGNGNLGVMRDPQGFKPLVWGECEDYFAVASESSALRKAGISNFKIVEPGSAILISRNREPIIEQILPARRKHCHFEAIYFEEDDSHFENIPVYDIRSRLGLELASVEPLAEEIRANPDSFVVFPAPISANVAAKFYARYFGLESEEVLKKNSSARGFINSPEKREYHMSRRYDINPSLVSGKRAILIEDSAVRLETLRKLIKMIRDCNPLEIHVRVTDCPITHPCFYGINMSTYSELIASRYPENLEGNIEGELGVNSFRYQQMKGLTDAFQMDPNNLCLACLNGDYPTPYGRVRAKESREQWLRESEMSKK
jgi:amidophosphoribosyltransferase